MQDFKIERNEAQWKTSCRMSIDYYKFYSEAISIAVSNLIDWFEVEYNTEEEFTQRDPKEYLYEAILELKNTQADYFWWYTQVCKEDSSLS